MALPPAELDERLPEGEAPASRARRGPVPLLAGVVLVIVGQHEFADRTHSRLALVLWLAGLVLAAVSTRDTGADAQAEPIAGVAAPRTGWRSARTIVPALIALSSTITSWRVQHDGTVDPDRWALMPIWVVGVGCAALSVWQPVRGQLRGRLGAWWRTRRPELAWLAAFTGAAAALTLARLGSVPWTFNGDEGAFSVLSRKVLDGEVRNPFSVGYMSHPTLYNALQAATMSVAGETVFGARLISAILGTLSVPLAFVFTQRLLRSRRAGVVAATLLATFHVHLYWSRSALPNGASTFFVLLVLVLLDRASAHDRPIALVLAGISVGAAQYFYFSNRILILVVIAWVAATTLATRRARAGGAATARDFGARAALIAGGFVVAIAPLAAFYDVDRSALNARVNQISIFHDGWLHQHATASGTSVVGVVWHHLTRAAMLPFRTAPQGFFYRGGVPFVGWPIAVAAAVGLAIVMTRWSRPRWIGLSTAYWATVVGLALTTGPAETQRWVMAAPLVCIFAAVAVDAVATALTPTAPTPTTTMTTTTTRPSSLLRRRVVTAATGAFVAGASCWSLHFFFHDTHNVELYSDTNTEIAEHMAREIERTDPHATVYFSGAPRMTYGGFNDLVFRTPGVHSVDVLDPWTLDDAPPVLDGVTIFVAVPERTVELEVVQRWFPGGVRRDTTDGDGTILYTSFTVAPPAPSGSAAAAVSYG